MSDVTVMASEKEIIEKILNGEKALFEVLIRRTNAVLYKIGRMYGFNHQDSEDLMQETHLAAYLNLHSFGYRASYKTWISKIMIHKCQYKLKYGYAVKEIPGTDKIQENTLPMHSSGQRNTQTAIANNELASIIENSVRELPLNYRTVFVLREMEGYSVAETAALLGLTEVNVKVRLNRARAMMQKELEKVYTRTEIYTFHLSYCDQITERVMKQIML